MNKEVKHPELREVTISKFDSMLASGIIKFQYLKKNGDIRTAIGTRCMDFISQEKKFAGGICIPKEAAGYETYYDLEQMDYRVFKEKNLLGVIGDVVPPEDVTPQTTGDELRAMFP